MDNIATPIICIASGFLQHKFGPHRVLMFTCLPYIAGWIVAAFASAAAHLYLSRILVGISHALVTTNVYEVEVSHKEMRGTYLMLAGVFRY